MTPTETEDRIQALLKKAEPLRVLDDDDPRTAELTAIVDQINKLRAIQALDRAAQPLPEPNAKPEGGDADPTREELEQLAHSLGIEFSPRIGDAMLAKRISDAQKAAAQ